MQDPGKKGIFPDQSQRIAIFDLDGTLIKAHLWAVLLKYNLNKKERIFASIWYFVSHIALMIPWKLKLISTKKCFQSWAQDVPQMVKGINAERGKEVFGNIWDRYISPTLKKKTFERLKWHQKRGNITILASNSPQNFVDTIKENLNFDFAVGAKLEIKKNKFTGKTIPSLPWGKEKAKRIKEIIKEQRLNIDFKGSFTYSDSFSDLPILELVGSPVVVDPDEKLLQFAKENNWEIL